MSSVYKMLTFWTVNNNKIYLKWQNRINKQMIKKKVFQNTNSLHIHLHLNEFPFTNSFIFFPSQIIKHITCYMYLFPALMPSFPSHPRRVGLPETAHRPAWMWMSAAPITPAVPRSSLASTIPEVSNVGRVLQVRFPGLLLLFSSSGGRIWDNIMFLCMWRT